MKTAFAGISLMIAALSLFSDASPLLQIRSPAPEAVGFIKISDWTPELVDRSTASCTLKTYTATDCSSGQTTSTKISASGFACVNTVGDHSFSVSGSSCQKLWVSADPDSGCESGVATFGGNAGPGCYSVNTGYAWSSSYAYIPSS